MKIGFIIMCIWLLPAGVILGAVSDRTGNCMDAGCIAFVPIINIFIALGIILNGGRLL